MNRFDHHWGVRFSVAKIAEARWKWAIHPPEGVKGFAPETGEISGDWQDAVDAAKRAIMRQKLCQPN